MSDLVADVFVEDRAHESFLVPLVQRIAHEESVAVVTRVRSARGGHARAIEELKLYQRLVAAGAASTPPDLLIVGIDGNCTTFAKKTLEIHAAVKAPFADRLVVACPDPHIERWFLADPDSFASTVGLRPAVIKRKCERDIYKGALANAVRQAGHPATLGGIEFAMEIVAGLDLYRAGKHDHSLKTFVADLRGKLRTWRPTGKAGQGRRRQAESEG